jgi:hypothetical protein
VEGDSIQEQYELQVSEDIRARVDALRHVYDRVYEVVSTALKAQFPELESVNQACAKLYMAIEMEAQHIRLKAEEEIAAFQGISAPSQGQFTSYGQLVAYYEQKYWQTYSSKLSQLPDEEKPS